MSVIVSLPPRLLDHSFPREPRDLVEVEEALGELAEKALSKQVLIFVTDAFRLIVEDFDWSRPNVKQLLQIHRLLTQLFLVGQEYLVEVDCAMFRDGNKHPVPEGLQGTEAAIDVWSEEMAAALTWHDQHAGNAFYIGIACPRAFAGGVRGNYPPEAIARKFPIVGPLDLKEDANILKPAFVHTVPHGMYPPAVSFTKAKKNLKLLGAVEIAPPGGGGSHYRVTFSGSRSWTLDPNDDPVPACYLDQLKAITGFEYPVVCYVLANGEFPPRKRFDAV